MSEAEKRVIELCNQYKADLLSQQQLNAQLTERLLHLNFRVTQLEQFLANSGVISMETIQ